MPRYIDADAVNRVFVDELGKIPSVVIAERIEWTAAREAIIRCARGVSTIPTADVVERKKGKWEEYLKEGLRWKCSECGSRFDLPFNFCPHCGAEMEADYDIR